MVSFVQRTEFRLFVWTQVHGKWIRLSTQNKELILFDIFCFGHPC